MNDAGQKLPTLTRGTSGITGQLQWTRTPSEHHHAHTHISEVSDRVLFGEAVDWPVHQILKLHRSLGSALLRVQSSDG